MDNKKIVIFGGGIFEDVRPHLALAVRAFGHTARKLNRFCIEKAQSLDTKLILTKMADPLNGSIVNRSDLLKAAEEAIKDPLTKIVFFNAAVVDFEPGFINRETQSASLLASNWEAAPPGRLNSHFRHVLELIPVPKIISKFRYEEGGRKDIFLVGWKATSGATPQQQYEQGLNLLKKNSCNLVLANDIETRNCMIICPEEAVYHESTDLDYVLENLVEMTLLRSHLTFTRSTVVAGESVPWDSELVPQTLRDVVDYCIERGAYKQFLGVTAGHFAVKLSDTTFLTSRRKTDFNDMKQVGLVLVETDGPDTVIAYGSKPSVGGQSQRIVFEQHPQDNCVVHFHCPLREGSQVPVASQREYECGSHACGNNTATNLKQFGNLKAVMLDQHGPNIVFNSNIDPQEVIDFIEANFNLEEKTGGYQLPKVSEKI